MLEPGALRRRPRYHYVFFKISEDDSAGQSEKNECATCGQALAEGAPFFIHTHPLDDGSYAGDSQVYIST